MFRECPTVVAEVSTEDTAGMPAFRALHSAVAANSVSVASEVVRYCSSTAFLSARPQPRGARYVAESSNCSIVLSCLSAGSWCKGLCVCLLHGT